MSVRLLGIGSMAVAALVTLSASAVVPEPRRPEAAVVVPQAALPVPTTSTTAPPTTRRQAVAEPREIRFPRLDIRSSLTRLGLQPDGSVEVPPLRTPEQAGWYALGARPGEVGAAVVLGHVDGYRRPGVFYRLREAKVGDEVVVIPDRGEPLRFTVDRVETVDKDRFPSAEVYGTTERPELRLVTCGGSFDRERGRYNANVIVYASLSD